MAESSDVTACAREREPAPSDSLRTFGAVVQALREHAGLSRVDLGARVQFSKHTVESVELGRRMPDESFVKRAEEALGNTGALRKAAGHLTLGEAGLVSWFRRWPGWNVSVSVVPVAPSGVKWAISSAYALPASSTGAASRAIASGSLASCQTVISSTSPGK